MIDTTVEALIFDFGGVLINIDYQKTIDAFKALGINNFDEMYSQANQSNVFDDFETGKISPQYFINQLLNYLPRTTTPNHVVSAWNAMILDVPASTVEILTALQGKYRLFLLSNTNALHLPVALKAWEKQTALNFYDCFERVYVSHEVGMRKPHVEIFHHVCSENQLNPHTTLFIDDSIQHVQGAEQAGLSTIYLDSNTSLASLFS